MEELSIQTFSAKFTSEESRIIYATQTELFSYDIDIQENIIISDNLSYESNFDYSQINHSVVFYEQNSIVKYNLLTNDRVVLSDNAMSVGGDNISYLSWSLSEFIYYECVSIVDGYYEVPQICRVSTQGDNESEQITDEFKFLLAPISNYSLQEKIAITEINEDFGSILYLYDTLNNNLDSLITIEGGFIMAKTWSKDNNSIIFSSYYDDYYYNGNEYNDFYKIWIYNIQENTLLNITNGSHPIFYQNQELNIEDIFLKEFYIKTFPNPFNPKTLISLSIPEKSQTSLGIYNIKGNLISTLLNEYITSGNHTIEWNAEGYPSGVYFVKLDADEFSQTQKLMLVK